MEQREDIPAFPSHGTMGEVNFQGMTLRDYFAAKALEGICANPDISKTAGDKGLFGQALHEPYAKASYDLAEAMLAEKNKRGSL